MQGVVGQKVQLQPKSRQKAREMRENGLFSWKIVWVWLTITVYLEVW